MRLAPVLPSLRLAVGVRVALLVGAYLAVRVMMHSAGPIGPPLAKAFQRWDGAQYVNIARDGYGLEGEARLRIVFYPLYPLLVRLVSYLVWDYLAAALLVTFVAAVAAGALLQALVRLDADDASAARALRYFFLFPMGYFLCLPYTEALFMALLLWCFLAARRGRWASAGIAGMLACATRVQGLAILPAVACEAWQQRARRRDAAWILVMPLGFAAYLGVNWWVLGDPLAFVEIQRSHWHQDTITPWEGLRRTLEGMMGTASDGRVNVFESRAMSVLGTVVLLLAGSRWLRPSYQVYGWVGLILILSAAWPISFPRYVIAIFPIFLVLGHVTRRPWLDDLLMPISAVLFSVWSFMFLQNRWAF